MAKPEEHYAVALQMASMANQALAEAGDKAPTSEVLALAQLHATLGLLQVEIERPGRGLILPNGSLNGR